MPKLTDAQTLILTRAATRPDNLAGAGAGCRIFVLEHQSGRSAF